VRRLAVLLAPALAALVLWLTTPAESERVRELAADRDSWRVRYHAKDAEYRRLVREVAGRGK
jgi:hypothetical protein